MGKFTLGDIDVRWKIIIGVFLIFISMKTCSTNDTATINYKQNTEIVQNLDSIHHAIDSVMILKLSKIDKIEMKIDSLSILLLNLTNQLQRTNSNLTTIKTTIDEQYNKN